VSVEQQRAIEAKLWEILAADLGGDEQANVLGLAVHVASPRPGAIQCSLTLGYSYGNVEDMSDVARGQLVVRDLRQALARLRETPVSPLPPEFDAMAKVRP
jgi:hypothetical protein